MALELDLWRRMSRMQEELDRLFWDFFDRRDTNLLSSPKGQALAPLRDDREIELFDRARTDYYETDKEIVAKLELPGVRKEDIMVDINEDGLEVKVERKKEHEEKKKNSYLYERSYAGYYRCLQLPPYAKIDGAKAEYKDGLLTITIPKDEDKKKAKTKRLTIE